MKPLVYKKTRGKARASARSAPRPMKLHITKGDTVQIISGDDKGKRGQVLRVEPRTGRITVEGVNVVKKHQRAQNNAEGGSSPSRHLFIIRRRCWWTPRAGSPPGSAGGRMPTGPSNGSP